MYDFTAFKAECREKLHEALSTKRVTLLIKGDADNVCEVDVRIHTKEINPDVVSGQGYATRHDIKPKIIFNVPISDPSAYSPNNGDIVLLNAQLGYVVNDTEARDFNTITANCKRLSKAKLEELAPLLGC